MTSKSVRTVNYERGLSTMTKLASNGIKVGGIIILACLFLGSIFSGLLEISESRFRAKFEKTKPAFN